MGAEPLYLSNLPDSVTLPPDWTVTLWASPAQRTRSLAIAPIPTWNTLLVPLSLKEMRAVPSVDSKSPRTLLVPPLTVKNWLGSSVPIPTLPSSLMVIRVVGPVGTWVSVRKSMAIPPSVSAT